ncbi:hypothetical protein [Clostridium saccharobutylicum]|uniref:Uncharacterized protein n=5 Tax=Clostridium saccharobutylicum TaxID=169679 RepID=U5MRU3_CLOSA|nr:hypothetical protein [Clostridium saccharobutylicum]AGX43243.1 hypothetical protein CLSA_c22680 [Clostridium saccharobutylicum DSM 13864]AQR90543.1 hypothetical protein CLOSC_22640 [Clostridium saccharobutylicum]AQS00447.1 hypothetical protein CSACC_22710 [Clostridium saccharobutylicum]AQS10096.1 hypothetical protein CLOBY_22390 [Clostridium saccharobutylicum]AQS14430.1 hypothetical protein CLOSACC_22710 [Clostridium saccharobutylicum]
MINRDFYFIKQSTGDIWIFSFRANQGIIYKIFKKNSWSEDHILTKEALKNFSVTLFQDNSINVLYQDLEGKIILSEYIEGKWNKKIILTNEKKELFKIYFKTFVNKNELQIIFSIFNKENTTATLFHQALDEKNKLSKPKMLDIVKYDYEVPFILYSSDNKDVIIMYQRFAGNHEIGYQTFNKNLQKWSNFNSIDKSKHPFDMNEMRLVILSYENDKEQLTTQLKHELEEQKAQNLFYEKKFKAINKAHTKFMALKNELKENVTLLQENLKDKEEKLKLLENFNIEKEIKIRSLKEELSQDEIKILYLMRKVRNLNTAIRRMYTSIYRNFNMHQ